ncbi:MAG: hypothetical protein AB7O37_19555 [Vicinamibacteria bacterium]
MRRLIGMLMLLAASAPARAANLSFEYTIERERGGAVSSASFLKGFDTADALRLKVKLEQSSYCYVIMRGPKGDYRLTFPEAGARPVEAQPANQWAKLPKSTFVRLSEEPGVERMYLVIASERVPELEQAAQKGQSLEEGFALDVRDRYQTDGSYSRDLAGNTISVRYRPRGVGASVVVEEISLRARD